MTEPTPDEAGVGRSPTRAAAGVAPQRSPTPRAACEAEGTARESAPTEIAESKRTIVRSRAYAGRNGGRLRTPSAEDFAEVAERANTNHLATTSERNDYGAGEALRRKSEAVRDANESDGRTAGPVRTVEDPARSRSAGPGTPTRGASPGNASRHTLTPAPKRALGQGRRHSGPLRGRSRTPGLSRPTSFPAHARTGPPVLRDHYGARLPRDPGPVSLRVRVVYGLPERRRTILEGASPSELQCASNFAPPRGPDSHSPGV